MKYLLTLTGILIAALLWAEPGVQAKETIYIGVQGCTQACHKKDDDGDQRSVWRKSKHSLAYKTLGSPEATRVAKQVGLSGPPEKAEACLICHTTGYGTDAKQFRKSFKLQDGVQCEACHGPGDRYRLKKVMIKILKERGVDRKGTSATAQVAGLTYPTENTCKTCHVPEITQSGKTYKNANYKAFDFQKALGDIKHLVPQERRKLVVSGGVSDED